MRWWYSAALPFWERGAVRRDPCVEEGCGVVQRTRIFEVDAEHLQHGRGGRGAVAGTEQCHVSGPEWHGIALVALEQLAIGGIDSAREAVEIVGADGTAACIYGVVGGGA